MNTVKNGFKLNKSDKSLMSMINLDNFNSMKSNSRNSSYRNKPGYIDQNSILSQGHKKINSFNNPNDNFASQNLKGRNPHKSNMIMESLKASRVTNLKSSKRTKNRRASDFVIALGSQNKLNKALQGMKPTFPISFKRSEIAKLKDSKERSHRRSKQKTKSKWKSSPYKKKIASKLKILKTLNNDTPDRLKPGVHLKKKHANISEYSNFMNIPTKSKSNSKFSSVSRKSEKDLMNSNSRTRNRSKTKSDKFTFLTINNFKCNGFKFDYNSKEI